MTHLSKKLITNYNKLHKDSDVKYAKYIESKKQNDAEITEALRVEWLVAFTKFDKWCEKYI